MVALLVIMSPVLLQGSSQRTLPKENEPRQAFFFNRSHPTLGVSVQVWTPGRQHNQILRPSVSISCRNEVQNFASRSCNRYLCLARNPHSSKVTARACCSIHSWSGCRVIPDTQILRVSKWMKNSR